MKWLASMLSEKGTVSATRACMCLWFAVLILTWLAVALARGGMPEIPGSALTLSGLLLGAKLIQKPQEQP